MNDSLTTVGISGSDKHYWHRYTETYLEAFAALGPVRRVIEFGVFHGASIRWLAECFPTAEIIGADILPIQPDWPRDDRVSYRQVDQGDRGGVRAMLNDIGGEVDLIIDDGSHIPWHQATCLLEGLVRVRSRGLFILEDIHTSHPLQPSFGHLSVVEGRRQPNALNVLMAIQHLQDTGRACEPSTATALAAPGFFSVAEIEMLFLTIAKVEIYKRTSLPLRCCVCGGVEFDYVSWRCECGAQLFHSGDSMTALVWKR